MKNLVKIVVKELPETCEKCEGFYYFDYPHCSFLELYEIVFDGEAITWSYDIRRDDRCPLEEERQQHD